MKLRILLNVLHPETVVHLFDDVKLDLIVQVKDVPNDLKERIVNKLFRSYFHSKYDFTIFLKVQYEQV